MKKPTLLIFLLIIIYSSCEYDEQFEYEENFYWTNGDAKKEKPIECNVKVYSKGSDTIVYWTNYYRNGNMKSKVTMINDLLSNIEMVLDTNGNPLDYGSLINGSGYVIEYSRYDGAPESEGNYLNGNREGWWKKYHFTGVISDSTYYENGIAQFKNRGTMLDEILNTFTDGPIKNNLYR